MQRQKGCIARDKRSGVWNFFWREDGKQHSKKIGVFPSKQAAWRAAMPLRHALESRTPIIPQPSTVPLVNDLVEQYRKTKMPERLDTRRGYESWLRVHILPRWGRTPITELHANEVEMWLQTLALAPKSRVHVRGILNSLFEFAMWSRSIPMQTNPISLVKIKRASKRLKRPRSLTEEQFHSLVSHLKEPFGTMASVCVTLGLRISECLALQWADVDWLNCSLHVQRAIVEQNVDTVKTDESEQTIALADELLERLKVWKQATEFPANTDWIFASPVMLGRQPYSYTGFWRELDRACAVVGIPHLGTHSFRHTYRTWLDSIGTPIGVQQKLMRHSDIRQTMQYGEALQADLREVNGKIGQMALPC